MPQDDVDRDVGQKDGEAHGFDTEFLDDTDDTHALMFGVWAGLRSGFRSVNPKPKYSESEKNPHYWMLGYILGWLIKLGVAYYFGSEYLI